MVEIERGFRLFKMKLINFNDAWYNLDKLLYITDIFLYTYDGMGTVIKEHEIN